MANLSAPQADDLGPGAVIASAATVVVADGGTGIPAPPDTISALYNVQVPPGSMAFG